jgi:predicted phosphodiesterase
MRERRAAALASMPEETRESLEAHLTASQHASHVDWDDMPEQARKSTVPAMLMRPLALLQVWRYWRAFPRLAAAFVRTHAPVARFAVLGHTHRPGIWTVDDLVIINTGSFGFPGHPRAVVIDGDRTLRVFRIIKQRGAYRLRPSALKTFFLAE